MASNLAEGTHSGSFTLDNSSNTIAGTFRGNGSSLTGLNPANLSPGTAAIDISGNAATATSAAIAGSATTASTAGSAANFTGSLAGDVTGTQGDTVVGRIRGTPVSGTAPSANQHLRYDGSQWVPGNVALATDITGILADSHLSSNIGLLNANQIFSGSNQFSGVVQLTNTANTFVGIFSGNGGGLSNVSVSAANLVGLLATTQLSGTLPSDQLAGTYGNVLTLNNPANRFSGSGSGLSGVDAATLGGFGSPSFWQVGGNAGTTAGVNFLGTTDNQPLDFRVNGVRALRLEGMWGAPNVVGGASNNSAGAGVAWGTIGGGWGNTIEGSPDVPNAGGIIAGGGNNLIKRAAVLATISGGSQNTIGNAAQYASIVGGSQNSIASNAQNATISGGFSNSVSGTNSSIGGGAANSIDGPSSTIGGGLQNGIIGGYVSAPLGGFNTISGGGTNFIGGGDLLPANGDTIAGGIQNSVGSKTTCCTIGGGTGNAIAYDTWVSTVGGGFGNSISAAVSTIAGGQSNSILYTTAASGSYHSIGGGNQNYVHDVGGGSTISGGESNFISATGSLRGHSTIGGGQGNQVTGAYAVVPGGAANTAGKDYTFAAGNRAKAIHAGAFVWADSTDADFASTATNQFAVRAAGGVRLETGGAGLTVDGQNVLAGVVGAGQLGLELKVNGVRTLRLESNSSGAPNIIAGSPFNCIDAGTVGSAIGGGGATSYNGSAYTNEVASDFGTIGGGLGNTISTYSPSSTIGGGNQNGIRINAENATISGGFSNSVSGTNSSIGGGAANAIYGPSSTIGGGLQNGINGGYVIVPPGGFNTIGGGGTNHIGEEEFAVANTISGGVNNSISEKNVGSSIGGGTENTIDYQGSCSVIGGGSGNHAGGWFSTVAGGDGNVIPYTTVGYGNYHSIGGGTGNYINAIGGSATIGGGQGNSISSGGRIYGGLGATIGGGLGNSVSSGGGEIYGVLAATIGGGQSNSIAGICGTIPGGNNNQATNYCLAAGNRAKAIHTGAFVWADSTDADFASTATNQFLIRASGGVGIGKTNPASALDVSGTITASGLVRLGSETGTSEAPSPAGLVIRRVNSTDVSSNRVVARSDVLTLERDGTFGGFLVRYPAHPGHQTIACMGMNGAGAAVNFYTTLNDPASAGTVTVYSDSQSVVHFRCSFGNTWNAGHLTEVTLSRYAADAYWLGTVTSTLNQ